MTTAAEHFVWAKARAMEYVEMGEGGQALSSLVSDLAKHEGTRGIMNPALQSLAMGELLIARLGPEQARAMGRFIEGIPAPGAEVDR